MLIESWYSKLYSPHIDHDSGIIKGYNIAIVPQEDPVENATRPARMKVTDGTTKGAMLPEIRLVKKSAVCKSDVIFDKDQAKTRMIIAVNMVLKPDMMLPTTSWMLKIL